MRTASPTKDTELSLIKVMAVAGREQDMKLSRLQVIDRLQKLQARFKDLWLGPGPWLVLDGYCLPNAPVEQMLKKMDEYSDAVGMIGAAYLPHSRKIGILKMLFRGRADTQARKLVERAAAALEQNLPGLIRPLDPLKGASDTE